jgi:hypothetical protein
MLMNRLSVALRFAVKLLTGCLLLSEVCSSAQAEIVTVVYTGTLNTSYDFTGMSGAPNASVTGDAVSVTYVFNLSASSIRPRLPVLLKAAATAVPPHLQNWPQLPSTV